MEGAESAAARESCVVDVDVLTVFVVPVELEAVRIGVSPGTL